MDDGTGADDVSWSWDLALSGLIGYAIGTALTGAYWRVRGMLLNAMIKRCSRLLAELESKSRRYK